MRDFPLLPPRREVLQSLHSPRPFSALVLSKILKARWIWRRRLAKDAHFSPALLHLRPSRTRRLTSLADPTAGMRRIAVSGGSCRLSPYVTFVTWARLQTSFTTATKCSTTGSLSIIFCTSLGFRPGNTGFHSCLHVVSNRHDVSSKEYKCV